VDDALAVFGRDGGTGALTFVEALFDGSGGVDGLDGARDVSVSPDGDHVYVAAAADVAVAVFSRDSGSGQLTFVEAKTDGAGGADYLDGASALTVSGDGAHVYVVAAFDGALTVFDRDSGSGSLTFAEVQVNSPSIGLQRAGSVAVSADGGSVYATAEISHSLVRFERDMVTGALTDAQMERDGFAGANALKGAASVALTAEGGIYVAAHIDGAATLFETTAVCPLEPMPGCRSPRKSRLLVRDHDDNQKDKIVYKWQFGDETPTEAFGNPENEGGTDYALCVYDLRGGTTELRFDAFVPSGRTCGNRDKPCWRSHFGSYIFKDRDATPEGVQRLYLRHGADGGPVVSVVGKGVNLRALPGIPMGPPVTAQVINTDGECWSTTFTADDVKKNRRSKVDIFNARQ
jgi:hypothetical protein